MFGLTIRDNINNDRLDKYLSEILGLSRSFVARLIESEYIYMANNNKDKKKIKKSYTPVKGDDIYIDNMDRFEDAGILAESPDIKIDILYSNHPEASKSDYLIIYKPKGVLSHPNSVRDVSSPSVSGWLYHNFGKLANIGNFIRAGLVHRLDKETDGLMIVVLTEVGLKHFQNLFHSKSTAESLEDKENIPFRKFYIARCDVSSFGKNFLNDIGANLPFVISEAVIPKIPHYHRDNLGITKIINFGDNINFLTSMVDSIVLSGSANHINHEVSQKIDNIYIYLEILTGKTHQIRYHLSKYGLPIVGDYLYNPNCRSSDKMQLTAYRLERKDIDGSYRILELDKAYLSNHLAK